MSLPMDVARCDGQASIRICDRRETCRRYLDRPEGDSLAWWMPPQVPGPCDSYIEPPPVSQGEASRG